MMNSDLTLKRLLCDHNEIVSMRVLKYDECNIKRVYRIECMDCGLFLKYHEYQVIIRGVYNLPSYEAGEMIDNFHVAISNNYFNNHVFAACGSNVLFSSVRGLVGIHRNKDVECKACNAHHQEGGKIVWEYTLKDIASIVCGDCRMEYDELFYYADENKDIDLRKWGGNKNEKCHI